MTSEPTLSSTLESLRQHIVQLEEEVTRLEGISTIRDAEFFQLSGGVTWTKHKEVMNAAATNTTPSAFTFFVPRLWPSLFRRKPKRRTSITPPPLLPPPPPPPSDDAQQDSKTTTTTTTIPPKLKRTGSFRDQDLTDYTVVKGDTFENVALKYDMTAVELRRANQGVQPPLFPGQILRVRHLASLAEREQQQHSPSSQQTEALNTTAVTIGGEDNPDLGLDKECALCTSSNGDRIQGDLVFEMAAGFLWFHPADEENSQWEFSLDRFDIVACASVGGSASPSSNIVQFVWKNDALGFSTEQQVFFDMGDDVAAVRQIVEAIYRCSPEKRARRTMTSGVTALEQLQKVRVEVNFTSSESPVLIPTPPPPPQPPLPPGLAGELTVNVSMESDSLYEAPEMRPGPSNIISPRQALALMKALPSRLHGYSWRCIYNFENDGAGLHAFFQKSAHVHDSLLICRNVSTGEIAGVFASEPWVPVPGRSFFGQGETFVFACRPPLSEEEENEEEVAPFEGDGDVDCESFTRGNRQQQQQRNSDGSMPLIFPWSGKNEFIQTCSNEFLGVGGGGNFALYFDDELKLATSGPSSTFKGLETNALTLSTNFHVDMVELWTFELALTLEGGASRRRSSSLSVQAPPVGFSPRFSSITMDSPAAFRHKGMSHGSSPLLKRAETAPVLSSSAPLTALSNVSAASLSVAAGGEQDDTTTTATPTTTVRSTLSFFGLLKKHESAPSLPPSNQQQQRNHHGNLDVVPEM